MNLLNEKQTSVLLPKKKKPALKCLKLPLHDAILTSGAPRPGVPAERFYQKHQFLAKKRFLLPRFQTLPI